MKNSYIIICFFILGIFLGLYNFVPSFFIESDKSIYALYLLMVLVGMSIGLDNKSLDAIKKTNLKIIMVPVGVIIGTFLGVSVVSLFINIGLRESLAIGAGFGWYSLSSIFITNFSGESLGVVALLSNIFREIIALSFAPFFVKYFGKVASISAGGATSMDTTLPVITKYSGKEYVVTAIFNGALLSILVPFLITFIYSF